MPNNVKAGFLRLLADRYGYLKKLEGSQSLYELAGGKARVYIRYSGVHRGNRTFFGLREQDLRSLQGQPSVICFLWGLAKEPLVVPYSEYEEVFDSLPPAGDGQYKVQIYLEEEGTELYVARAGRFNVDAHLGWGALDAITSGESAKVPPDLSHCQVQTLLGSIGALKGFDIWVPLVDRNRLDWNIAQRFAAAPGLPASFESIRGILQEVDVIWLKRGASEPRAFFEVEHSTPIYSGLLRFNDIRLVAPTLRPTFSVVANEERRETFVRQLNRPTFLASGLVEQCTFMDYPSVFGWYNRVRTKAPMETRNER